jgi:hypothetical protein
MRIQLSSSDGAEKIIQVMTNMQGIAKWQVLGCLLLKHMGANDGSNSELHRLCVSDLKILYQD